MTVVEAPSRRSLRYREKRLETETATKAWVSRNWPLIADGKSPTIPSTNGIASILAVTDRRFTLQRAVFIDQETDAIIELDKPGEPVALVSPGLVSMRREETRQEYFEMKQSGYDNLKESELVNVRIWTR